MTSADFIHLVFTHILFLYVSINRSLSTPFVVVVVDVVLRYSAFENRPTVLSKPFQRERSVLDQLLVILPLNCRDTAEEFVSVDTSCLTRLPVFVE